MVRIAASVDTRHAVDPPWVCFRVNITTNTTQEIADARAPLAATRSPRHRQA